MNHEQSVVHHYGGRPGSETDLGAAIGAALEQMDLPAGGVTVEVLGPVDEFHVGGREATLHLVDQLACADGAHLLDVGCGIGGAARLLASGPAGRVTGIDLTPAFVETGQALNQRVGLDDRVELQIGSALDLPFDDASFDGAVMLHVGMNIEDKAGLMAEVARVLRPGTCFGVYDLMRVADGEPDHPVPWASGPATSHLGSPADYCQAAAAAGFEVTTVADRTAFAEAFFDRLRAAGGARSPLGLHLLMGPETPTKVANMIAAVEAGVLAPIEMVLTRD